MTPDDILDEALHILERDGWHQGGLVDYRYADSAFTDDDERYEHWQAMRNAPVCTIGALHRAITGAANGVSDLPREEIEALRNAMIEVSRRLHKVAGIDPRMSSIPEWNDDENTTKEEVLLVFKRARHGEGASA